MVSLVKEMCGQLLERMEERGQLKCSVEEGLRHLDGMGSVSARVAAAKKKGGEVGGVGYKPSVALPYCGKINDGWCLGVRWNHGLHSQCTNSREGLGEYCTTCKKGAENSASGKPPYGDIRERGKFGLDYRDPKGKQTICYANVAEKLGVDLEKAKEEAAKLGWTIPEDQLEKVARKRGRPAKAGGEVVKKKRGRKKKEASMSDKISELVEAASTDLATSEEKTEEIDELKQRKRVQEEKLAKMREAIKKAKLNSVAQVESSDDEEAAAAADLKKKEEAAAAAELKKKEEAAAAAELKKKEEAAAAAELKKKEEAAAAAELKKKEEAAAAAELKKKEEEDVAADAKDEVDKMTLNMSDLGLGDTDDEEEEEEEEISLTADSVTTREGTDYYMVTAYGLENVLFSVGENPEVVGQYEPETGVIKGLSFEDE
jgi:hypothetical protein